MAALIAEAVDETRPADRELASTWPSLIRETRALFNALLGGAIAIPDASGSGKKATFEAEYQGVDDNGDDIWILRLKTIPEVPAP